ncbi:MAG: helix-turn-helix transcriptional regulator [Clostridia bacterium]|nr:helix-turn-helix transcriptional regulator [Clostridia bacterium]
MKFENISPVVQHAEYTNFAQRNSNIERDIDKITYTYRFLIIDTGGFTLRTDTGDEPCGVGDIVYLPARCRYSTLFLPEYFACCNISFSMLSEHSDDPARNAAPYWFLYLVGEAAHEDWFASDVTFDDLPEFNAPLVIRNFPGAVSRAKRFLTLWNSPERFARLALNAVLTEFLADLANYLEGIRHQPRSVVAARIADYIDAHVAERLTCQRIADAFSYHPSYVSRIIREYQGCSLHDYVIRQKIDAATKLLLESEMTITDIAYYLSFYDSSHFTKTYSEITGRNPSDVRRKIL